MGKYMNKSKLTLTPMETAQSSSLGVTTRAKTLALRRLQNSTLRRSRRLANNPTHILTPNSRFRALKSVHSGSTGSGKAGAFKEEAAVPSFQGLDRSTRETTPCSFIGDSDTVRTPGSTTRAASSSATNRGMQTTTRSTIPVALEMDEFFAGAEQHQQRTFTEKYNFDPVNETPLPGRYEWERVNPQGCSTAAWIPHASTFS